MADEEPGQLGEGKRKCIKITVRKMITFKTFISFELSSSNSMSKCFTRLKLSKGFFQ